MTTTADVARIARQVAEAGEAGRETIMVEHVTFDLQASGWCARFVRQVHEAALGLPPFGWPWAAPNARAMEDKLVANHKRQAVAPVPGDIMGLNKGTGPNGHIAIYLGGGEFAENTSSTTRGPGTRLSKVTGILAQISGYYRVLPVGDPDAPDEWAKDEWEWAWAKGIITTLKPRDPVTAEHVAVIAHRLSKLR